MRASARRAHDRLDRHGRAAGRIGDFAILLLDDGSRRVVSVETAQGEVRDPAARTQRAVGIDDVKQDERGVGALFDSHVTALPRSPPYVVTIRQKPSGRLYLEPENGASGDAEMDGGAAS